jgi:chemotaxis protein MotB
MAKKQHHEEHENHERWLVSYADFITLLFAFFVVMYSTSRVDNKRLAQVVHAIQFAMHFKGTGGVDRMQLFEGPPTDGGRCRYDRLGTEYKAGSRQKAKVEQVRKRIERKLSQYLQQRPENVVQIDTERDRLNVRLSASRFFDAGQAAIRPEMIPVLDVISTELVAIGLPIRIEGHTDEGKALGARFRDNWDLSASRAAAVASYLQRAHGIDGKLLAAAGFGSTRPLTDGSTPEGREANRRVEMMVEFNPGD